MSNPFDDLKEDDEDTPGSEEQTATESDSKTDTGQTDDESSTPATPTSSTSDESVPERSVDRDNSDETADESLSPAETGPAFEYSEVKQKPFYARTETVNEFENEIRTTIIPKLAEAGVLDEENREIHDAILRLANEQPERVAELVLEERRQSGGQ